MLFVKLGTPAARDILYFLLLLRNLICNNPAGAAGDDSGA